jgi:hypothetical protein
MNVRRAWMTPVIFYVFALLRSQYFSSLYYESTAYSGKGWIMLLT